MRISFLSTLFLLLSLTVFSQPVQRLVKVSVVPDSPTWNYKVGNKVKFTVSVTQSGIPVKNVSVRYTLSEDMLEPFKTENITLKEGEIEIQGNTLKKPGFLRCRVYATVDGVEYEGRGTAAFSPELITPTTKMPDDFLEFWKKAKEDNKKIPMDARLILLPEKCTEKVNVYELNIQNYQTGSRVYGILCVPKAPGKHPAFLRVPGAGVRPYNGDIKNAERGFITLDIGIHGIPVTMEQKVYDNLKAAGLNGYQFNNWDNKDKVYYKRVYMGCVRAIDYIFSMPEFDGKNLVTYGGSQGGALSIITAALDNRVKGAIAFYPALADMNGYLYNRTGGWPHMFRNNKDLSCILKEKEANAAYYDVVNFARLLKVPVFYGFGYNDTVCPPTTSFAVYNTITTSKTQCIVPEIEHYLYPEMWTKAWEWADTIFKK